MIVVVMTVAMMAVAVMLMWLLLVAIDDYRPSGCSSGGCVAIMIDDSSSKRLS